MEKEMMNNVKIGPNVIPIYADEANVNSNIKINIEKNEKGEDIIKKVGKIDIMFFDQVTKTIISRVTVDPFTAKFLGKILIDNATKVIQEVENTQVPKQVKEQIKNREKLLKQKETKVDSFNTYIG
jgi:hypothetical protein